MTKEQYMQVIERIIISPRNDLQKIGMLRRAFELYVEESKQRRSIENIRVVKKEDYYIDFANKYGDLFVHAKWDGCCDINCYHNGATFETKNPSMHDVNYIHVCELREFISFLTAVADAAEGTVGFEGYEA